MPVIWVKTLTEAINIIYFINSQPFRGHSFFESQTRPEGKDNTITMNHVAHSQYELEPERLRQVLPGSPGVYCFKDPSGRVIYVGKAKDIKKRVLSYFRFQNELSS